MIEAPFTAKQGRYKNLDGLRGIAALMVVLGHIERYKPGYGFKQLPIPFLPSLGAVAVTVFFVLSGFVITNLLLKERLQNNRINVRHFYVRRMLRIFPLYFLVLLLGYFLYRSSMPVKGIILSVFFLPNVAFLRGLLPPVLYPIWSIGVEEQFYAVHPFIMRFVNVKKLPLLFGVIIIIEILLRNLYLLPLLRHHHFYYSLHIFFTFARFDTILLGCMAAIYFNRLNNGKADQWFFTKPVQYALWFALCLLLYLTVMHDIAKHEFYAFVTAAIIINLCRPATSIISFSSKPLLFLGKISYGIYMGHKFGLYVLLYLISKMGITSMFVQNVLIYGAVTAVGIVLAWLSYTFFESYFLGRKEKYY